MPLLYLWKLVALWERALHKYKLETNVPTSTKWCPYFSFNSSYFSLYCCKQINLNDVTSVFNLTSSLHLANFWSNTFDSHGMLQLLDAQIVWLSAVSEFWNFWLVTFKANLEKNNRENRIIFLNIGICNINNWHQHHGLQPEWEIFRDMWRDLIWGKCLTLA